MKIKVNKIFIGLIALMIVTMNGCSVLPTAIAVIVDTRSAPVNKAGTIVTATYGTSGSVTGTTKADGTASLNLQGATYPIKVTASDGSATHTFSTVTLTNETEARSKIIIVQGLIKVMPGVGVPVINH